jgi:hypothetical protein
MQNFPPWGTSKTERQGRAGYLFGKYWQRKEKERERERERIGTHTHSIWWFTNQQKRTWFRSNRVWYGGLHVPAQILREARSFPINNLRLKKGCKGISTSAVAFDSTTYTFYPEKANGKFGDKSAQQQQPFW